jgi:hypothetical protein
MRSSICRKLALALPIAAAVLATAVATAPANRFEIPNWERGIRAAWSEFEFVIGQAIVRCPVTLEGSFHSQTFAKIARALVGYVTRATVNEGACTGGTARALAETLPWHVQYRSFEGTLPVITRISFRLVGARFGAAMEARPCLITTTEAEPATLIATVNGTQELSSIEAEGAGGVGIARELFCVLGETGRTHFRGITTPTVLGGTARIRLRLI